MDARAMDAEGGAKGKGIGVGFAARLGQYFKRPDIRKELTRYAAHSLLSQNNPFVRAGPGWRRGALSRVTAIGGSGDDEGGRGAREGGRRGEREERAGGIPPAAILLFVQPPSAVTLAPVARRQLPARPIGAFNRQQPANVEKRINL